MTESRPELPSRPQPLAMQWSEPEKRAIENYVDACIDADRAARRHEHDDALLKRALDVLNESVDVARNDYEQADALWKGYPTRQGRVQGFKTLLDIHEAVIAAIEKRLSSKAAIVLGEKP